MTRKPRRTDFEPRLRIDLDALDEEIADNAELLYHVGMRHVDAIDRRETTRERMREIAGEFAARQRGDNPKMAQTAIDRLVEADEEYLKAKTDHLKACREEERWAKMVRAFEARSRVLDPAARVWVTKHAARTSIRDEDLARKREQITNARERLKERRLKERRKK